MRSDVCGNKYPILSDTYGIEILNFYNGTDVTGDISLVENGMVVQDFFLVMNSHEESALTKSLDNEQYVDELSHDYTNRVSEGYIEILGFYGTVKSANGKYKLKNDVAFCEKGGTSIPIPTYVNENSEWILEYNENITKWTLSEY